MNVFVARFDVVNNKNAKFEEDKNSNLPFIGTLLGGKAHSLIINGSVFKEQKLIPNKAYLCQNVERPYVDPVTQESKVGIDVQILTVLSPLELVDALKEVGAPIDMSVKTEVAVEENVDQESI
jgi:hypothetical protein